MAAEINKSRGRKQNGSAFRKGLRSRKPPLKGKTAMSEFEMLWEEMGYEN
jgi:hypothetical protein